MRLSELAGLTIYDIDIPTHITRDDDGGGTVRVKRKGGAIDGCSIPTPVLNRQEVDRDLTEQSALLLKRHRTVRFAQNFVLTARLMDMSD